jgi:hypothetical protein
LSTLESRVVRVETETKATTAAEEEAVVMDEAGLLRVVIDDRAIVVGIHRMPEDRAIVVIKMMMVAEDRAPAGTKMMTEDRALVGTQRHHPGGQSKMAAEVHLMTLKERDRSNQDTIAGAQARIPDVTKSRA